MAVSGRFTSLRRLLGRLDESLLARLVTAFLALSLATVALVALGAFLRARATMRTVILDRLQTVAIVKEGELRRWVDDQQGDLGFVAGLPVVRAETPGLAAHPDDPRLTPARARLLALLDSARFRALDMEELFILTAVGGRVVVSTDRARIGEYRVSDLFFRRGLRGPYIQNVYPSPSTGRPTMTVATPIRDAAGRTVAVLAGHLNLANIDRILADRTGLGETGEAYLVTHLGDFVSAERFGRDRYRRGVHSDGVRWALAGESGGGTYDNYAGVPVLGAHRWIAARQLALMVETRQVEAFAPARSLVGTILAIGVGSILLLVGAVILVARRVARPILAVANAASRVAGGDFAAEAPIVTRDEVGVLARAFNDMTARLRALVADLNAQVEATRRAYRAMEESRHLLQAVMDNSANLIVVLDTDDRFLLVNRRFEGLFGLTNDAVKGKAPARLLRSDAGLALEAAAHTAVRGHRSVERDIELEIDGLAHVYHLVAFPLVEAGHAPFGAGIIGVDLSERTRAEEERRRLEAGVQQAQKLESLGLLAGGIAHDFNNILTAIVGGASLALHELPAGTPVRGELELVVAAAERAAKLTRQMLAYAGRASFAVDVFDLNTVIREMAELIAVSVPKSVALAQRLASNLPPIRADRTQVSQIVLNLITNAAEAIGPRGGHVILTTRARRREDVALGEFRFQPAAAHTLVELEVSDAGAGMTPATMERIFDPFYSTKGSGRGLGLAAVLGIVKQSGGTLKVTSAPDAGTTFDVLFPAAAVDARPLPAAPAPPAERPAGSGAVLLVDDEDIVRKAIGTLLERGGYEVLTAENGQEAVAVFREQRARIRAVVLDVTMPVMDGGAAYRAMRDLGLSVPVIFSSGYDRQDTVAGFTGPGIEFLQKPYRPAVLLERLRALLAAP